ncbi:hypothetical protein VTL71DRAFT_5557 [Oculimacula yallundae]|uniref:C2H2-type domain-containing protein n=1 Tax=Oculimacula yallundae TaxID=86028 RepID=A0ABR4C2I3_9HELO
MDPAFPGGFQGDFQDFEYGGWAGMQSMLPEEEISWSSWLHDDPPGLGVIDDWRQSQRATADRISEADQICSSFAQAAILEKPRLNLKETSTIKDHVTDGDINYMDLNKTGTVALLPVQRSPLSVKHKRGKVVKLPKLRIQCPHPGCKLTFPRKYELRRHQDGVHYSKLSLHCFVHGCDRIAKPFPRKDKFHEHLRKQHSGATEFRCVFEGCDSGPWSRDELVQHCQVQHSLVTCVSEQAKISLAWLALRAMPLSDGSKRYENQDCCPLAFLGCKFTSADNYKLTNHLEYHELIDRSKGFEALESINKEQWLRGNRYSNGLATCPVCRTQVCGPEGTIAQFANHLELHTREERGLHGTELAEIFRPFLTNMIKWNWLCCTSSTSFRTMIRAELEEAGAIPRIEA